MNASLRALLVEDSLTDAKLIVQELRRTHASLEYERVADEDAMRDALRRAEWDVVLCDWALPTFGALAALSLVKETVVDLPFILVSGTIGDELAVEAMRAGARDYVLKDKLARLVPAIDREVRESKARRCQRQVEARFRAIIENSADAVTLNAADGTMFYVSPVATALLGFTPDELRGTPFVELVHLDDRARVLEAMQRVRREPGESGTQEVRALRRDGSTLWAEATFTNMLPDPIVGAVVCNLRDISERRRAADALHRSESQLRQAQKMEAVGRLAGGIAHDFNNLLSVILSYSELLLADLPANDPSRRDIDEIGKAGRRAADLTRQLLTFSRRQVLEPKVVDLNELLTCIERMLQRILGEDVELVLVQGAALGRVRVDPGSMDQVVLNLAVNARDAMPTGGKLTIETANVVLDDEFARAHVGVSPGPHVLLAVTDTGSGIEPTIRARIFEPFFTTKELGKGTGLGLSTVFGIVHQSGGSVWVNSEPGLGTSFKVYLPRVDASVESTRARESSPNLRGSETILVVEDEDQVRRVIVGILRKHGYRVLEARHPGEALLVSENHAERIHLLLSDVVMPQMSGPELASRLVAARPDLKVLCISGYTDDSIVRHGVLGSRLPFLQKPITPQTLTRKVRDVLDAAPSPLGVKDGDQ